MKVNSLRVESYSTVDKSKHSFKQITIQLKDKNGNPIYKEDIEVNVKVEGPAILLGLESSSSIHEDYQSYTRKTSHGKSMGYIKKSELDKKVKVVFQSPVLKSRIIIL
jgi:beta-galactosidase